MNKNRKTVVRLTESKLRNIIKESVRRILKESIDDKAIFGNIRKCYVVNDEQTGRKYVEYWDTMIPYDEVMEELEYRYQKAVDNDWTSKDFVGWCNDLASGYYGDTTNAQVALADMDNEG